MALNEEITAASTERRRKRRWGDASQASSSSAGATAAAATTSTSTTTSQPPVMTATTIPSTVVATATPGGGGAVIPDKVLALQQSVKERLARAKQQLAQQQAQQQQQQQPPVQGSLTQPQPPAPPLTAAALQQQQLHRPQSERPTKRAKQYDLDLDTITPTYQKTSELLLRSDHGIGGTTCATTTTNMKKGQTSTVAVAAPPSNPYLAHRVERTANYNDDNRKSGMKGKKQKAVMSRETPSNRDGIDDWNERDKELTNVDQDFADPNIRACKPRQRNKPIKFVEQGKWQAIAERVREKAALASAAGFISGRKTGHTIQSVGMGDIYGRGSGATAANDLTDDGDDDLLTLPPRADAHPDTTMPMVVEWWDTELLPAKLRKQVATLESNALTNKTKAALLQLDENDSGEPNDEAGSNLESSVLEQASLAFSKTATLVQHIVPIRPAHARLEEKQQPVLHLTKKELKRQRKLRRQEKQRQLQDLQAAGLIPAPEPRLTLRNFIQVLGDQAYIDPSKIEQKVQEQMEARQRAHMERNEQAKLTKEQRAAKRAKKLKEDVSKGVHVALFYVKNLQHTYHRAKVDWNAQQNYLTGGVLECHGIGACVIVEGGPKSIQRFTRLMLVRMKWTAQDDDIDNDGEVEAATPFPTDNRCGLVWQGMAIKPLFHGFVFQSCESADQCRKILKQKGVAHYWDQVVQFAKGKATGIQLKLGDDDSESDGESSGNANDDVKGGGGVAGREIVTMQED